MEVLDLLENEIKELNIEEFTILELSSNGTLTIAGSFDFCYYHNIEIYFLNTKYVSCPIDFSNARFRLATSQEYEYIKNKVLFKNSANGLLICIEAQKWISGDFEKHYIMAEDVKYKVETVFYYLRENLSEGERLAKWLQK